jgi:hypothetical protein
MYPMMNLADVSARTLAADDIRAVCEIYPLPVVGGCTTAPSRRSGHGLPLVIAVALMASIVAVARRRARHGREKPGAKRI